MASEKLKRRITAKEKFEAVKTVILKNKTISEVCDEFKVHPNQYYRWQKEFFEGAFERFNKTKIGRKGTREQREKEECEKEIRRPNEVIAEVVKENIDFKKKNLE